MFNMIYIADRVKNSSLISKGVACLSTLKTSILVLFLLAFVGIGFSSCNQSEDLLVTEKDNTSTFVERDSLSVLRTAPTSQRYAIDESILQHFRHYCQRNAGGKASGYPNTESAMDTEKSKTVCCPTSYMMAAACLAKYKGVNYDFGGAKVEAISNTYTGAENYLYLVAMARYANKIDSAFLRATYADPQRASSAQSDRTKVKEFMQDALRKNKFVMVNITGKLVKYATVNDSRLYLNSETNPDLTEKPLYVSTHEGDGKHVILIIAIETNHTGDGVVTYIDPLALTRNASNRRYVKYSTLLNSMKIASESKKHYNAIAIGLK